MKKRRASAYFRSGVERRGTFLFKLGAPLLLAVYLFTPQKSIQFFTLFLILLVTGSKVYSEYLTRHLRLVRRDRELRVFRREWLDVELWAENSGFLPAFMLVLGDTSGGIAVFRNIKHLCTLGGKSRRLFSWEAFGSDRGVYTLGPAFVRGSDPLGLFPFTVFFEETSRLFVYPAPAFAALKAPGGISRGSLITSDPFSEDLTRPRSLREYSPGDDSKRINWKVSARVSGFGAFDNLLVNEYEPSLSYPMVIFLNADPGEYPRKKRELHVERVIEAAAALCLMTARERQPLGLIVHTAAGNGGKYSGGKYSGGASGNENTGMIVPAAFTLIPALERLAALLPFENGVSEWSAPGTLRPSTGHLLEKGKSMAFGTRLVYAGPALDGADSAALETLKKRRLFLEYLFIDEKNLGYLPDGAAGGVSGKYPGKYQIKETGYVIL